MQEHKRTASYQAFHTHLPGNKATQKAGHSEGTIKFSTHTLLALFMVSMPTAIDLRRAKKAVHVAIDAQTD